MSELKTFTDYFNSPDCIEIPKHIRAQINPDHIASQARIIDVVGDKWGMKIWHEFRRWHAAGGFAS